MPTTSHKLSSSTRSSPKTPASVLNKLQTSAGGFYAAMPRLVYRTEYFAGGRDGNILITKGQDNDEEFIMRGVFQISRNDFHFTPDANYDPANIFHGRLADLKLNCQLTAAPLRNQFQGRDIMRPTVLFGTLSATDQSSSLTISFKPRTKLMMILVAADSNGDGDGNSSTCTDGLSSEFDIATWPVADRCQGHLQDIISTHNICPLPAYDEDHILIPPLQYEEKLKGALIEAHFAFCHHHMKNSKHDIFEAILCQAAALNVAASVMDLVLNTATGGNIKLVLHLKLYIIAQPAQDAVQDISSDMILTGTKLSGDLHNSNEQLRASISEVLLTACPSESHTPDTEHSHDFEACSGQAYGQGAPVYPCGCYRRTALTKDEIADAIADASEQCKKLKQEIDTWTVQIEKRSGKNLPLKRKRSMSTLNSDSIGNTTPRQFGRHLTNVQRAESVPVLEVPKCRTLGKAFEFNGHTIHETLVDVGKHLEAAMDRQTEVLSKIYHVLESRTIAIAKLANVRVQSGMCTYQPQDLNKIWTLGFSLARSFKFRVHGPPP
ncbi:hypothetical protein EV702DRAFT_1043443 [Suillus placidus]|uniref:Uncharacterized protein n=1 Tax=Suillus placidus TaxID=48579 RepID=A0A9P7A1K8_9AGAM|nr:hypothetical protein EV702DRAFT_1043443 [Suillus placidus]